MDSALREGQAMPVQDDPAAAQALPVVREAAKPSLPVPAPPAPQPPSRKPRRWLRRASLLLVLLAIAAGYWWWLHSRPSLPPGFASGNGRLEADPVDIATKFAGRILQLNVDEGDLVKAGQVLAVMDTRDLEAQLRQYQQLQLQAQHNLDEAKANYAQQQAAVRFAQQQVDRTTYLVPRGSATQQTLDQQRQQLDSATAALSANEARIAAAERAANAAQHQVERLEVNIADNSLVAPKEGPVEYRVANVGEVLPVGGKVFTMLDASYVYMDIYLPTAQAGRVRLGSEARIMLDAFPDHVIPAQVVFVASQAQFTPRMVETKEQRDRLMFRMRLRIDPNRLEGRAALVRSGLPGEGYVRTDEKAAWPADLQPSPRPPVPQ
jgi:HlyD family secretion protein